MPDPVDSHNTSQLILEAARRAVAARGPVKLTLSAVAEEAGVSRPTLYRWYPTKAILLAALAGYEVELFDRGLKDAIEPHRSGERRVDAALRYLIRYLDDSIGASAVGADADFALQSLADSLEPHVLSLAALLGDSLECVPAVSLGAVSRGQAAELFLRVAYSHYLVPHRNSEELLNVLRGFAGLGGSSIKRGRQSSRS
jgi:AcrR family transcriptional regulator